MEYFGTKVGPGLGIGKVLIVENVSLEKIPEKLINSTTDEKKKLKDVINNVVSDYDKIINEVQETDIKDLCQFYKMLLLSPSLVTELEETIEKYQVNAAGAIKKVLNNKETELSQLDNAYLRERSKDIQEVRNKLLRKLIGVKELDLSLLSENTILVSKEINPTLLLSGHLKYVKGIISEIGGKTSHVGILSTSLGIPSIFGIENISEILEDNEIVFVDGDRGVVITDMTNEDIKKYEVKIAREQEIMSELKEIKDIKAVTKDNHRYHVCINTGDLTELNKVNEVGADGIGLFRTEFLFLNKITPPSEEYLFNVYRSFAENNKNKVMIIRTLDIGGDKKCPYIDIPEEANPFLGYRAIRYCLDNKDFFKVSLRAMLRASNYGKIQIMYPMISNIEEVIKANEILDEAKDELANSQIPFDRNIKVGVMIEIPSAALMADTILEKVDFLSIGTNDLTQYTLAVDRGNQRVSKIYNYFNPGVLKLIKMTIDASKKYSNKQVGMCGEMASDPLGIILLVGMGLDEFSVNISRALKVKKLITLLSAEDCQKITEKVMKMTNEQDIEIELDNYAKKVFGKYY